jgi:hypothetical protein
MPGVVAFYKHTDMTNYNIFTPKDFGYAEEEEVRCVSFGNIF